MTTILKPLWVFVIVVVISLAGLAKTQQFYGTIYRGWDAQFYYSLARSLVYDGDGDVTNDLMLSPSPKPFDPDENGSWRAPPRRADGGILDRYPVGMSLAEAPFVWIAGKIRLGLGAAADRSLPVAYSTLEIWIVATGLTILFASALAALYSLLSVEYGTVPAAAGILACWTGTSLLYYSAIFPFMTHAISFSLLVAIFLTGDGIRRGARSLNVSLVALGLWTAALLLVRPQQVAILLFFGPLLLVRVRRAPTLKWLPGASVAAAACALAVLTQMRFNLSQVGVFTFSGYGALGEGFHWLTPRFDVVFMSPSRGLLLYSPVFVVAAIGLWIYRRSVSPAVWPMVLNALFQVYLVASWSSPEQGDAFGARMLSDNAAPVAVGVAVLLARASASWAIAVGIALVGCVACTNYLLVQYVFLRLTSTVIAST